MFSLFKLQMELLIEISLKDTKLLVREEPMITRRVLLSLTLIVTRGKFATLTGMAVPSVREVTSAWLVRINRRSLLIGPVVLDTVAVEEVVAVEVGIVLGLKAVVEDEVVEDVVAVLGLKVEVDDAVAVLGLKVEVDDAVIAVELVDEEVVAVEGLGRGGST